MVDKNENKYILNKRMAHLKHGMKIKGFRRLVNFHVLNLLYSYKTGRISLLELNFYIFSRINTSEYFNGFNFQKLLF